MSRSGASRAATAPVVRVATPVPKPPRDAEPPAALAATLAAAAGLARTRRIPPFVKGAVLACGLVWSATLAYLAWWSRLPPVDASSVLVDWTTAAALPVIVVALLFAWDVYPRAGGFVLKTAWLAVAAAVVAGFSLVRFSMTVAGYAAVGTGAFLPLHAAAGQFLDVLPGVAVTALAHASLSLPSAAEVLWRTPPGLRRG